jgi:hypothetical protein
VTWNETVCVPGESLPVPGNVTDPPGFTDTFDAGATIDAVGG